MTGWRHQSGADAATLRRLKINSAGMGATTILTRHGPFAPLKILNGRRLPSRQRVATPCSS